MQLSRKQLIIVISAVFIVLLLGSIFLGIIPGLRQKTVKPPQVKIVVWGVEDRNNFDSGIQAYQALRPNVQVDYKEIDPENYENELINALAANRGPDVFMFHSDWLPKHYDKTVAVGDTQFTLSQFQKTFPKVAEQDFAPDRVIYALPLYIDTLALYYNQDIFDSSGVALPPTTWSDFQNLIPKLRRLDKSGNIIQEAAAIGGSLKSIDMAVDLLELLMIQSGTQMTDDSFNKASFADRRNDFPGLQALEFYTKFSDPESVYYTWNDKLNAMESFTGGKTAMMFGYNRQKRDIKEKNPFLNFRAIAAPQINSLGTKINVADYWGLAVSKKSQWPEWGWDLIIYLTTNEIVASNYLDASGNSPALKTLIDKYLNDPELGTFAQQALTARSWPQIDSSAISSIFSQMIEAVINKKLDAETAIDQAELEVTNLMNVKR